MTQDGRNHKSKRDEQAEQILKILGLFALVIIALLDAKYKLDMPSIVYLVLAGVILGVDNVKRLLPGGK